METIKALRKNLRLKKITFLLLACFTYFAQNFFITEASDLLKTRKSLVVFFLTAPQIILKTIGPYFLDSILPKTRTILGASFSCLAYIFLFWYQKTQVLIFIGMILSATSLVLFETSMMFWAASCPVECINAWSMGSGVVGMLAIAFSYLLDFINIKERNLIYIGLCMLPLGHMFIFLVMYEPSSHKARGSSKKVVTVSEDEESYLLEKPPTHSRKIKGNKQGILKLSDSESTVTEAFPTKRKKSTLAGTKGLFARERPLSVSSSASRKDARGTVKSGREPGKEGEEPRYSAKMRLIFVDMGYYFWSLLFAYLFQTSAISGTIHSLPRKDRGLNKGFGFLMKVGVFISRGLPTFVSFSYVHFFPVFNGIFFLGSFAAVSQIISKSNNSSTNITNSWRNTGGLLFCVTLGLGFLLGLSHGGVNGFSSKEIRKRFSEKKRKVGLTYVTLASPIGQMTGSLVGWGVEVYLKRV